MAMIAERELGNHGFGLAGKVKTAMLEGIGTMEVEENLRFAFLEGLGLDGNRFGESGEFRLKAGGDGGNLRGFDGGTSTPGVEKSEAMLRGVERMKGDLVVVRI